MTLFLVCIVLITSSVIHAKPKSGEVEHQQMQQFVDSFEKSFADFFLKDVREQREHLFLEKKVFDVLHEVHNTGKHSPVKETCNKEMKDISEENNINILLDEKHSCFQNPFYLNAAQQYLTLRLDTGKYLLPNGSGDEPDGRFIDKIREVGQIVKVGKESLQRFEEAKPMMLECHKIWLNKQISVILQIYDTIWECYTRNSIQ